MDKFQEKETLLLSLYKVFDTFVERNFQMACTNGCASCCTQNVTLTTLEAQLVLESLKQSGRPHALARLETSSPTLFRPRYTINDLALACFNRQEPPEEELGPDSGVCPLLENDLCLAYEVRPFACRSFLSLEKCQPGGQANIPATLVSVITACQQIIEHLDEGGLFGNLTDLLVLLSESDNVRSFARSEITPDSGLARTKPLPGFLIHPDDMAAVKPFLDRLFTGNVNGEPFHVRMNSLRRPAPPNGSLSEQDG